MPVLEETEVAHGVRVFPFRTPTLPPATHTNTLLVGFEDAVIIEPATPYPDEIDRFVAWIDAHRGKGVRPEAILATHHHGDHMGGAAVLRERLGLPIWVHRLTAERRRDVAADRLIEHGEVIELGGTALEAHHTPGHAPGHLCFRERESNTLIAGDMIAGLGTILIEPVDGDMTQYLDSLAMLRDLDVAQVVPAHGDTIRDPSAAFDRLIQHRGAREAKVLAALHSLDAAAPAEDLLPVAYADTPRNLWPLALQSTLAHLIKLERDGLARHIDGHWAPTG